MSDILCYSCSERRAIPGNAHVRCAARVSDKMLEDNPILGLGMILCTSGFGWANFDPCYPEPVLECEFYEKERGNVR